MKLVLSSCTLKSVQANKTGTGVLIGAKDANSYVVISAIPTPVDNNDNSNAGTEQIDYGWCAEHARQVARMLPGGVSVVGMFGPSGKNLARMLLAAVSSLSQDPVAVVVDGDKPTAYTYPKKTRLELDVRTGEEGGRSWQLFKCLIPRDAVDKKPTFWVVDGCWSSAESKTKPANELGPGTHSVTLYTGEQHICGPESFTVCGTFTPIFADTCLEDVVEGVISDAKKSIATREEVANEERENSDPSKGDENTKRTVSVERVLVTGAQRLGFTDYKTNEETLEDVADRAECILGMTGPKVTQVEETQEPRKEEKEESSETKYAQNNNNNRRRTFLYGMTLSVLVLIIGVLAYTKTRTIT